MLRLSAQSSYFIRSYWETTTMGILSWIVFGLIAGMLARWIFPGGSPGGVIVTILVGIIGAIFGGWIGTNMGFGDISGFNLRSLGLAVVGALVLLTGYRLLSR